MKIEGTRVSEATLDEGWFGDLIPKINRPEIPIKFDKYLAGSLLSSFFLIGLPTPHRIIANIAQSFLLRAAQVVYSKQGWNDLLNFNLIFQIGATVLIGELASRGLKLHGSSPSSQTPRMPMTSQNVLQFRSASSDVKTRMIEAAYYDQVTFDSIMLALRKPEDFAWHHKSMIVHELRAVLTTFHPERAASLEANLATIAERPDIGNAYSRLFSRVQYDKMEHILVHNYEAISELKDTIDIVGLVKTLLELG